MKKRKGILLVLTALSLGMFATVPAVASVAGEQTWVWSGTGGSAIFDMDYLNTDADDSFNRFAIFHCNLARIFIRPV